MPSSASIPSHIRRDDGTIIVYVIYEVFVPAPVICLGSCSQAAILHSNTSCLTTRFRFPSVRSAHTSLHYHSDFTQPPSSGQISIPTWLDFDNPSHNSPTDRYHHPTTSISLTFYRPLPHPQCMDTMSHAHRDYQTAFNEAINTRLRSRLKNCNCPTGSKPVPRPLQEGNIFCFVRVHVYSPWFYGHGTRLYGPISMCLRLKSARQKMEETAWNCASTLPHYDRPLRLERVHGILPLHLCSEISSHPWLLHCLD